MSTKAGEGRADDETMTEILKSGYLIVVLLTML